jgi:hypothetical protein
MVLVGVYKVNIKEVRNLKVYYDNQNPYMIGWFSIPCHGLLNLYTNKNLNMKEYEINNGVIGNLKSLFFAK